MSAAIAMQDNPALLDPRGTLSPGLISLLRAVAERGGGLKIKSGWMIGGKPRKPDSVKPLKAFDLVREDFSHGKHRLVITYTGRCVLDVFEQRKGRRD